MRASAAVALLLVTSASIFGIATSNNPYRPSPAVEPVWVNGVMGVWDPDNGQFVPATSPNFNQTCERIQRRREERNGYYSFWHLTHSWYYSPNTQNFSYGGSWFGHVGDSGSVFGSSRGGIGETGHGFGHGGGE